ncbi:hypothetical protein [Nannocystis punicea]|uniref:hypothetical protein n=1 Tax=Nannocystis punicea TaxID=2995304 RepID=UPI003530BC58
MAEHERHGEHPHRHGAGCGHLAVQHEGHVDYLHEGHLHHPRGEHYDEHRLAASTANPSECTPEHRCGGHADGHVHGPDCGHPAVPHGDHVDYLVGDHLHHPCEGHCDHHGRVTVVGAT